jgi:hypothetical protein
MRTTAIRRGGVSGGCLSFQNLYILMQRTGKAGQSACMADLETCFLPFLPKERKTSFPY